jgi:choline dehydrogenase
LEILLAGIKLARKAGETSPLRESLIKETAPGPKVQSDEDWLQWLREEASTEFHPSSTCAMLPKNQGGVVDANLLVYGLANVRVADASIIPISLSTHLMSSTYGVAEQASDIIRLYHHKKPTTPEAAFSSSDSTPAASAVSAKKSTASQDNGGSAGNGRAALLGGWSLLLLSVHVVVFGLFM